MNTLRLTDDAFFELNWIFDQLVDDVLEGGLTSAGSLAKVNAVCVSPSRLAFIYRALKVMSISSEEQDRIFRLESLSYGK